MPSRNLSEHKDSLGKGRDFSSRTVETNTTEKRGQHVRSHELELLDLEVTRAGGSVRYLSGARYGLGISIFRSEVPEGSGPPPHVHDYNEIFALIDGRGRWLVGAAEIDAAAGDVVIVPAGTRHTFRSLGPGVLRHIAIHEAPVFIEHRDDDAESP